MPVEDLADLEASSMNTAPYFNQTYIPSILENEPLDTMGFSGVS